MNLLPMELTLTSPVTMARYQRASIWVFLPIPPHGHPWFIERLLGSVSSAKWEMVKLRSSSCLSLSSSCWNADYFECRAWPLEFVVGWQPTNRGLCMWFISSLLWVHCCHNCQDNNINHFCLIVIIKRLSRREVVAKNALPSLDKVNIDNKDGKGDDKLSEDEMLIIEFWPVHQHTSYNWGGGRGQRPASSRGGGQGFVAVSWNYHNTDNFVLSWQSG